MNNGNSITKWKIPLFIVIIIIVAFIIGVLLLLIFNLKKDNKHNNSVEKNIVIHDDKSARLNYIDENITKQNVYEEFEQAKMHDIDVNSVENDAYINSIKHDIYIKQRKFKKEDLYEPITRSTYRLVDLNSKKLYIVTSEYADEYYKRLHEEYTDKTTCKEKELTDNQIEKIKTLYDYSKLNFTTGRERYFEEYFIITIDNNIFYINELPFEDDLW